MIDKTLEIPTVLSFEKRFAASSICVLRQCVWEERLNKENLKMLKPNKEECFLTGKNDTLSAEFHVAVLPIPKRREICNSCNENGFRDALVERVKNDFTDKIYKKLSVRYVNNMVNTRLFKNFINDAFEIETVLTMHTNGTEKTYQFNSKDFSFDRFIEDDARINEIADAVCATFIGKNRLTKIKVCSYLRYKTNHQIWSKNDSFPYDIGFNPQYCGGVYIDDRSISAILRTIDTWYPNFNTKKEPISIEMYGNFRKDKANNFKGMLKKWIVESQKMTEEELFYIAGVIIRGCVLK